MSDQDLRSGEDIDLGDRCSSLAYRWAKTTFVARRGAMGQPVMSVDGSFANVMDFGGLRLALCSDGVGTKVEVAERTGRYDTLGFDLVAMVVDDLAANGAEPVNLSNVLDVDRLDPTVVDELMSGLARAAREAGVAVTGGEIAELGSRVGGWGPGMHFNWSATALGVFPEGTPVIDGSGIDPEDVVVALPSRGMRSNGFSLARRILGADLGPRWHEARFDGRRSWGEVMLTPSRVFAPLLGRLRSAGCAPRGIAHVTGGGVPGNLARVLAPRGLGARLDDLPPPPDFLVELVERGSVEPRRAYRLWNMGTAMMLVFPRSSLDRALGILREELPGTTVAGVVTSNEAIVLTSGLSRRDVLTFRHGGGEEA